MVLTILSLGSSGLAAMYHYRLNRLYTAPIPLKTSAGGCCSLYGGNRTWSKVAARRACIAHINEVPLADELLLSKNHRGHHHPYP